MCKAIRSVFIFVLVIVLTSCEYWNKDMLGYLEYWGSNSIVGRVIVTPTPENIGGKQIVQPGKPVTVELHLMNGQSIPTTVSLPSQTWSPASSGGTGTSFTNRYPNAIDTAILNLGTPKNGETLALNFQLAASDGTRTFPSYNWGSLVSNARPVPPTDMKVIDSPPVATWRAKVTGDHADVNRMEVKWSRKGGSVVATDILTKGSSGWTLATSDGRTVSSQADGVFTLQAPDTLSQNTTSADFNVEVTLFDEVGQTSKADLNSALSTSGTVSIIDAGLDATNTMVQVELTASNATTIWYRIGGSGDWRKETGPSCTIDVTGGVKVEAKAKENGKLESPVTQHTAAVVVTFNPNGGTGGPVPLVVPYGQAPSGKLTPLPKRGNQSGMGGTGVTYTFTGYNTRANGTGEEYYDKDGNLVKTNWTVTKNTPLYAQWELSGEASAVVDELKKINTPGTYAVKVTGTMTSDQVPTIRDALRTLQGKLPDDARVELDLSKVTGLNSIPDSAFNEKKNDKTMVWNLTKVILPDTVTSIGTCAFDLCTNLTYVDLGSGIKNIEREAFDYCYKLATIRVSALSPPTFPLTNSPFRLRNGSYSKRTIEVPQASLSAYKSSNWANLEGPAGTKVTIKAQQ